MTNQTGNFLQRWFKHYREDIGNISGDLATKFSTLTQAAITGGATLAGLSVTGSLLGRVDKVDSQTG